MIYSVNQAKERAVVRERRLAGKFFFAAKKSLHDQILSPEGRKCIFRKAGYKSTFSITLLIHLI